jgi:predicted TIM-barrel fold metal-dependent hydrolase
MIIDVHTHIYESMKSLPKGLLKEFYDYKRKDLGEEEFEKFRAEYEASTVDKLVEDMDEAGVDMSVVLPLDHAIQLREEPDISIWRINEYNAEAQEKYPKRIIAFVGVDPLRKDAISLLEKGIKEWGLKGVKLMASSYSVDDAEVQPFMAKVNEFGVPLVIHTGADPIPYDIRKGNPQALDTLLIRYPRMKIIAAHLAKGYEDLLVGMIKYRPGRLYSCITGWQYEYQRSRWHFLMQMRYFMDRIPGALMMGTDWPSIKGGTYLTHKEWFDAIRILKVPEQGLGLGMRDFSQGEKNMLLGENAKRLFGLE